MRNELHVIGPIEQEDERTDPGEWTNIISFYMKSNNKLKILPASTDKTLTTNQSPIIGQCL